MDVGAEVFKVEDKRQACILRAWTRALGRTVGSTTAGAVLESLEDAGLLGVSENLQLSNRTGAGTSKPEQLNRTGAGT